ncbi:hypothetical protein FOXYSP1_20049 [Fusarium oxysporum f. sp. phaseoli]
MPRGKEKHLSFDILCAKAGISMTLLTLTTIFRAKLLTEVRAACLISACIIPKLSPFINYSLHLTYMISMCAIQVCVPHLFSP